jgi:hypothetical protein
MLCFTYAQCDENTFRAQESTNLKTNYGMSVVAGGALAGVTV